MKTAIVTLKISTEITLNFPSALCLAEGLHLNFVPRNVQSHKLSFYSAKLIKIFYLSKYLYVTHFQTVLRKRATGKEISILQFMAAKSKIL